MDMGFRNNAIATVWKIQKPEDSSKYCDVQVSISRFDKKSNEFVDEFSGFVRFVGTAAAPAAELKERDRIILTGTDVNRRYDKENGKEYINFTCFSFIPYDRETYWSLTHPSQKKEDKPDENKDKEDNTEDQPPENNPEETPPGLDEDDAGIPDAEGFIGSSSIPDPTPWGFCK